MEKMTPGPANRVDRQPPSKANPVSTDPDRGDGRARSLEGRQGLAAEDDRQDHGEPAEGGHDPADDRDRADLEPREVREVRARADEPEEDRERERRRVRRQGGRGHEQDRDEQDRRHQLHAGGDPEAPDDPAREGGDDVERAPREGGAEAGDESEGHRRSLAARRPPRGGILPLGTGSMRPAGSLPGCKNARPASHPLHVTV